MIDRCYLWLQKNTYANFGLAKMSDDSTSDVQPMVEGGEAFQTQTYQGGTMELQTDRCFEGVVIPPTF